jgi:hypothetical protein
MIRFALYLLSFLPLLEKNCEKHRTHSCLNNLINKQMEFEKQLFLKSSSSLRNFLLFIININLYSEYYVYSIN